jgi:hypothetical protein
MANMKLTGDKRRIIEDLAKAVNNDLTEAIIYFEVLDAMRRLSGASTPQRAPRG